MTKNERLAGCIIGGAIGDAWGSAYENEPSVDAGKTYYVGGIKKVQPVWSFTDDTQLTLITLQALVRTARLSPTALATSFLRYYEAGKITGMGASTLKALQDLRAGAHWSQAGRSGEYAAGNGAAMRIAPFAFWEDYDRESIRDFCRLTHQNDEAYTGALAIIISIRLILNENWQAEDNILELIAPHLPDTNVSDRILALSKLCNSHSIADAARFGTNGYVVNSVPFAIFCASQVKQLGMEKMFQQIIASGGDTDTNASIAGQIAGALLGEEHIPITLKQQLSSVPDVGWLYDILSQAKEFLH